VKAGTAFTQFFEWAILGMVSSGYLAVALSGALDLPTLAVAGAAIVFRGLLIQGLVRLPFPEWVANAAALAYVGFYAIDYYYLSREFLPSTVHLVFFLAAVLLVRARSPRDYFFLQVIALLEVLAASILSSGLSFLVCLAAFLLCGIAALLGGEIRGNLTRFHKSGNGASNLPAVSLYVFAGVVVMSAGLFVVLPRTAHAALQHLMPERFHLPGFSNQVRLGQIGEIQQSRTPVMHIRIYDPQQAAMARVPLRWRGSALATFDGKRWFNSSEGGEPLINQEGLIRLVGREQQWRKGPRIVYDVQLKSLTGDTLFFAGIPEFVRIDSPQVIRSHVGGYRTGSGWQNRARYSAYSFLEPDEAGAFVVEPLSPEDRLVYLGTPRLDPRIAELSRQWTAHLPGQMEKARAIEQRLRSSYSYTLQLLDEPVDDPVAHFLFTRKKGHCEYFASSMALMLRTIGIPSRVATGFQDGIYNPVSGWRLVRTSDAHTWVEAFVDGRGWTSFDPTPADTARRETTAWSQVVLYLDAMEVFWQEWVMSYDLERQVLLADRMGQSGRTLALDWAQDWEKWWRRARSVRNRVAELPLPSLLLGAVAVVVWLTLVWWCVPRILVWWRSRQQAKKLQRGEVNASDATLLYERMLRFLKKQGSEKPAWMTPQEFSGLVQPVERAVLVRQFTGAYHELRYGGDARAATRMVALLEEMEAG